jgi:hypothetical protein
LNDVNFPPISFALLTIVPVVPRWTRVVTSCTPSRTSNSSVFASVTYRVRPPTPGLPKKLCIPCGTAWRLVRSSASVKKRVN